MPKDKRFWSLGSWVRKRVLRWLFGENEPLVIEGDPWINIPAGVELRIAGNAGSDGQVLKSRGVGQNPIWEAPRWSEVVIDVDKDMGGRRLTNVGAPVGSYDVLRLAELDSHKNATVLDHPDGSVTRAKLEYPTTDVSFRYLNIIGKAVGRPTLHSRPLLGVVDVFADKAVETMGYRDHAVVYLRVQDVDNGYAVLLYTGRASADFEISKIVNGVATNMAYEAVNLSVGYWHILGSASGATLKGFRSQDGLPTTPNVSVTDTSFSSGFFGVATNVIEYGWVYVDAWLRDPRSPSPKALAYFEVPVTGSGTEDDPFRAQMPEEIVFDWSLNPRARKKYEILKGKGFTDEEIIELAPEVLSCRVNRFALTQSSLIKSGSDGKPVEYTAIVRIFPQPDRQNNLYPIGKCVEELKAIKGVRMLSREDAVRRAKQIDDKLHDFDLKLKLKPEKKDVRDYIEWRIHTLGVSEDLINEKVMVEYIEEGKGW